jgi:hypothetical protein
MRYLTSSRPKQPVDGVDKGIKRHRFPSAESGQRCRGFHRCAVAVLLNSFGARPWPAWFLSGHAAVGDYAVWNYFQSLSRPQNIAFVDRYRARYGPHRVTSDPMEAAYIGVNL